MINNCQPLSIYGGAYIPTKSKTNLYIVPPIVWTRSRTGDLSYAEHPCSLFVRFDDGVKSELACLFDVKSIDLSFSYSELTLLTTGFEV